MQRHALAHDAVDLVGRAVVPHGEQELFGNGARHRDQRHLAFPCLAEPALAAEFLYPAGTFATGVVPVQNDRRNTRPPERAARPATRRRASGATARDGPVAARAEGKLECSSALQVVKEFLADRLLAEQLVAGLARKRLEVSNRTGIRRKDLKHLTARHLGERFFRTQDRQRAVESREYRSPCRRSAERPWQRRGSLRRPAAERIEILPAGRAYASSRPSRGPCRAATGATGRARSAGNRPVPRRAAPRHQPARERR